jgi:ubiquitin thioesterase OTU1
MAAIRLRHPKGTSTIEIDLDSEAVTVQDIQQKIYAVSGILPSRQTRAWPKGLVVISR